jgi:hypothetical protein
MVALGQEVMLGNPRKIILQKFSVFVGLLEPFQNFIPKLSEFKFWKGLTRLGTINYLKTPDNPADQDNASILSVVAYKLVA